MTIEPLEQRTDQELIAAANAGDSAAFEALYKRYGEWTLNLARRFTGDFQSACDVMQETFLYLLRKFPGFELTGQMKTFLYPVVRHTALADSRKRRRQAAKSELHEPIAATCDPPAGLEELHAAMQLLDLGHREVVILRFVEDLSLQEIALAMQVPLGTVKSRLHHALRQLREDGRLKRYFEP